MKRLMIATALTLLTTGAYAKQPIVTCSGRVEAWSGYSEHSGKIESVVRIIGNSESCHGFFIERASTGGRRILRACPIGSRCSVKARPRSTVPDEDGFEDVISATWEDNDPVACAKQNFDGEEEHYCQTAGVRATLKMQRDFDRLARQGKLCGELLSTRECKPSK